MDFAVAVFWLLLAFLFVRGAIECLRQREDWMAAGYIALAGTYVGLAVTMTIR